MSQSATLYRISKDNFELYKNSNAGLQFKISSAKNYIVINGTFMGLEYILSKGLGDSAVELIKEIFNPTTTIVPQNFESLSIEAKCHLYENGNVIPYLDIITISKLNSILTNLTESDLQLIYNANEFNEAGIYPQAWSTNNSPNEAFNVIHLKDDFIALKEIIQHAYKEQDYIFIFIG